MHPSRLTLSTPTGLVRRSPRFDLTEHPELILGSTEVAVSPNSHEVHIYSLSSGNKWTLQHTLSEVRSISLHFRPRHSPETNGVFAV